MTINMQSIYQDYLDRYLTFEEVLEMVWDYSKTKPELSKEDHTYFNLICEVHYERQSI